MAKTAPDHHDAELLLKVYDLRREDVMRESRKQIIFGFQPVTFEDIQAIGKFDHPLNAAYRQVASYWEMVYGMAKWGVVHPDYFVESNGEGILLFARLKPHLERIRQEVSPVAFQNTEWVTLNTEPGRRVLSIMEARYQKMLAERQKA